MATTGFSGKGSDTHITGSKFVDKPGIDNTGLGAAEDRAAKRFQRSTSERNLPIRRPEPSNAARLTSEVKPLFGHQRRQSMRDPKAPQASALLQSSPSKRFAYDASLNRFAQPAPVPTTDPGSPHRRQASINSTSRFSFASTASPTKQRSVDTTGSTDFPPPVSFDDLQASLAGDERGFEAFLVPSANTKVSDRDSDDGNTDYVRLKGSPRKTGASAAVGSILSRDGSLRRQNSAAHRTNQLVGQVDSIAPPSAPININARRQSCFPVPNGDTSLYRQPRKSVGPGLLYTGFPERKLPIRKDNQTEPIIDGFHDSTMPGGPLAGGRAPETGADSDLTESSSLGMPRNTKAKSLLPPPRLGRDLSLAALSPPEQTTPTAIGSARSPGMVLNNNDGTPSSDKRFSVLPNSVHATGLAARTISPTDARRLKRMSMMPTPPTIPYTPPTPHPDTPNPTTHRTAPSPVVPRKSITPNSSRTTPDINRKSYSSGISNSSSTSYNSFINSTGPPRASQTLSVSRLPTLKTRIDSAPATSEEEVPPVPAIPKAYESPKTEPDQPFFSAHKSSLPFDTGNATSNSNTECLIPRREDNGLPRTEAGRQRRGLTVDEYPVTEKKAGGTANINRRTLQPLRLPPLNLLPLSTPTAAKIAALYDGAGAMNLGAVTPPLQLGQHTTPSTPMTASKASFSRSFRDEDQIPRVPHMRSSSSHHTVRPDSAGYRAPSSISSHIPIAAERIGRKSISPFVSSSLPKTSGDFGYLRQTSGATADAQGAPGSRNPKLTGPRLQQERKGSKDSALGVEASSPAETSGSSFGTSLRRKLSLTRKRSVSKSQSRTDIHAEPEITPKPPKHDNMPPPKLPASATWNGPLKPSPSPTRKQNPFRSGRKASNSSMADEHERNRSSVWNVHSGSMTEVAPGSAAATPTSKRTLRAQLENGPPQSSLSLRDFLNEAKTSQLDRDDLSAEEEMRRLALRRKDTEIAAKELDALRLRATAKERVGPSHALRIANLNIFERGEIIDYQDVYFCGTQDAKKHIGDLNAEGVNFGYDDERGDYNIVVGDHLAYRYEIIDILGKGSFGQVARCIDHKTGGLMAIKIIRNKKRFHQQALVEVDILQRLREWDPRNKHSMVSFTESFYFRGHLCISTELLGMNLYEFIKCHDFRGFSLKLIRRFAKQLLSSLVLLKAHKVIHCDLKPENVLLAHPTHSEIKVIDFGSSCLENEKVYTYIQSRFYRSPEVILGMTYGMPIDMWSLGCILAELLTGYPIFPGENEQEQLACIMEVFGPPEKHLIEKSTRKKLFFDSLGKPRLTVSSKGKRRRPSSKTLQQALKCEDEAFLDFITRCLRWDPERRLKPDEAIRHEFITGVKPSSKAVRPLLQTANSSPAKRHTTTYASAGSRPLPDPPNAGIKNGTAIRNKEVMSSSPIKAAMPAKRQSTVNGLQGNVGVKRTLNGAAVGGSALPRVTPRVGSGKPDMAAAAAMASLWQQKSR